MLLSDWLIFSGGFITGLVALWVVKSLKDYLEWDK